MKNKGLYKLVLASVFAALASAATMVIQIPSPMNGYINLGDCIVLLSGWILGPVYGFFAAGIGSALADIFTGYVHYAPGTFVIKGLVALAAGLLPMVLTKSSSPAVKLLARVTSAVSGEAIMVLGYFGYAGLLLGNGLAAASSIPGNLVQGVAGIISAVIIMELLERSKITSKLNFSR